MSFIEGMNELYSLNLSNIEMQRIGIKFGADVPAMQYNNPIIARGIGEKIEEINGRIKYYVVLIKPDFACDTKRMYEKLDETSEIKQKYNSKIVKDAIINKEVDILSNNLYNVFESNLKDIEELKQELISNGADGALMTGSGSCVYGIFQNKVSAKNAFYKLNKKYKTYFSITR